MIIIYEVIKLRSSEWVRMGKQNLQNMYLTDNLPHRTVYAYGPEYFYDK